MKKIIRKPGQATQILSTEPFDARRYVAGAMLFLDKSPDAALKVANVVIARTNNSREGWLLLFLASMINWGKLNKFQKWLRGIGAKAGLPKGIKLVSWVSDHVGIPGVWQKLLDRDFPHDEVMKELIHTFIVRISPTPAHKVNLALALAEKAIAMTMKTERDLTFAHAIHLMDQALAADPSNADFQAAHRNTLANAQLAEWNEVSLREGSYLELLANTLQPSLETPTTGDPRLRKLG